LIFDLILECVKSSILFLINNIIELARRNNRKSARKIFLWMG
jgi:hypothetical protein